MRQKVLMMFKGKILFFVNFEKKKFFFLRNGHPLADFSFFSFGTIKPFTALGGSITIIRNNEGVYRKMK